MIESFVIPFVTALNTPVGSRIFPGKAPDGTAKPYIVYSIVAASSEHSHQGVAFLAYRFSFSVYSESYQTAASVRDALTAALDGYTGTLTAGAESVDIASFLESAVYLYEPDTKLHHIVVDFEISHSI